MHHRSWFSALLSACALFALAPHARADGFYVTFTSSGAALTPRMTGAVFDATGRSPIDPNSGASTGVSVAMPVHVEVDSSQMLVPMLTLQSNNRAFDATVEFTTPDAQGNEQVYMVAKYTTAKVTATLTKFDPTATPTLKSAVEFAYTAVAYSAPAAPASTPGVIKKAPVLRAVGKTAPLILRLATIPVAAAVPPAHVDDLYFQATGLAGESADHPNQTRVTSFSFTVLTSLDPATGMPQRLSPRAIKIVKGSGAATATLQGLLTSHGNLSSLSVFFNQHRAGAADLTLASLVLTNASVITDTLAVASGSSHESLSLNYQRAVVSSGSASVTYDWQVAMP